MRIAVMTDSTAYIAPEIREELNIHMIPLSVVFGEDSYQEEIDLSKEDFYTRLKEEKSLPTTSQPPIGYVTNKLEQLAEDYDAVISIHLSSGISGTYQTVVSAGEMVEGIQVYAYDSEASSLVQAFYVYEAVQMVRENKLPEEIIARLDEMKRTMQAYFMVDDLTNLMRGGRLSNAQAFVGGLLQIKPILHFVDKQIVAFEKIRTRKKAINRILSLLEEQAAAGQDLFVSFVHANNEAAAKEMESKFKEKFPHIQTSITYFGPVIGTHLGEGAVGCGWYVK